MDFGWLTEERRMDEEEEEGMEVEVKSRGEQAILFGGSLFWWNATRRFWRVCWDEIGW